MEERFSAYETDTLAVEPDATTPRVFGILNIIFSLMAGLFAAYALGMALLMPYFAESFEDLEQARQQAHDAEIIDLDRQEEVAKTEAEKEAIRAERQTAIDEFDTEQFDPFSAMRDKKVIAYGIADGSTGLLLNLTMFISGVGLLMHREWARKLAIWTAGLKIVRLCILQAVNLALIVPIQVKQSQQMFDQMDMGGGAPPVDMGAMQGIMMSAFAVVTLVIGSVYPALCLWFLTRPRVKVVFQDNLEDISSESP